MTIRILLITILVTASFPFKLLAQTTQTEESGFSFKGYGSLNYFVYDWETDPSKRNAIDIERFTIYPLYKYDDRFSFKGEIEFEHGGTGVTKEFDKFEEFGEFETEVEAGGEVTLEQLHLIYEPYRELNFRIGKFKLPIGIASGKDEPTEYFTTTRAEAEAEVIPTNWYEMGVQVFGTFGKDDELSYAFSIVNGLDATGFSSANWVQTGYQGAFEMNNAENFAYTLNLLYRFTDNFEIGTTGYIGNTTDNRPKPDMDVDAYVTIGEIHSIFEKGPLELRGMFLYGHLQNADAVTQANKNVSNNLNVKRTPVASEAISYYVEGAYDISSFIKPISKPLLVFVRYEFYDTMYGVVKNKVSDNPHWERTAYTAGLNFRPHKQIVFKSQFTHRELGIEDDNVENTFSLGIGFEF